MSINLTEQNNSLIIDGTDESGCYAGDATRGPWVVFDPGQQKNVAGPFVHYWQACVMRRAIWLSRGCKPNLP